MTQRFSLAAMIVMAAAAAPVQATPTVDDRWLPFQGCWAATQAGPGNLVCIVPDGDDIRMLELSTGVVTRETRMRADGSARPVSQEGCSGTETTRWSANGRRLYLSTQMNCGTSIGRNTTGIFALLSAREWVSIQAIAVDNEAATRVIRYELVETPTNVPEGVLAQLRQNRLARETARYAAAAPLELSDIIEASKEVHGRAVEALLFERKQVFALDGNKLVTLANAGVPEYLVDAVVAVSNPDKFAIRDAKPVELEEVQVPGETRRTSPYGNRYCDEFNPWYSRYCGFGYGYGYGYGAYSRFGFSPFGYYDRFGYRTNPIIVIRDPGNGAPANNGKMTRRGYVRRGATSAAGSVIRSSVGSRSSSSSSSSSGSSGSSSSSSSSSSSRGKAVPKKGN